MEESCYFLLDLRRVCYFYYIPNLVKKDSVYLNMIMIKFLLSYDFIVRKLHRVACYFFFL